MPPTPYYEKDGIVIYLGDCRDVLPTLAPVDLVLTDPPYGIGVAANGQVGSTNRGVARDYGAVTWDAAPPDQTTLDAVRAAGQWQVIFGGNFFDLPPSSCWLVWDKDNTGSFADAELAWTNLPKAVRLLRWRWNGMLQEHMGADKEERVHPTQKPLAVMRWAISQAPDDCATILDPFMGSGTTLRAAKDLGRRAIGIEINEDYCKIAVERLRQGVLL
jgi:DNA modification methylase